MNGSPFQWSERLFPPVSSFTIVSNPPFRFDKLTTFPEGGLPPEHLHLEYRGSPIDFGDSVEQSVQAVWEGFLGENDRLFDGPMMSVYDVDRTNRRLYTQRTSFKYFLAKRGVIEGFVSESGHELPGEEAGVLLDSLRVLSSFTAVIVDGQLLLGIRSSSAEGNARLSFPGSGYLDPSEDTGPGDEVVSTREMIGREVEEELGIAGDFDDVRCMGVFEDVVAGRRFNPAIFSIITLPHSRSEVDAARETAPDAWEFEEFIYVPLEREPLEELLSGIPTVPSGLHGIDQRATLSSKACLMTLLVGAFRFGDSWYRRVYRDIEIEICDPRERGD